MLGLRIYQEISVRSAAAAGVNRRVDVSVLVETALVAPHTFETNLALLGELRPLAVVEVMSRISGRLQELRVERGDQVQKGQLLAMVDDADLLQQIHRAEATISVATAGVSRERANYDNLKVQVDRHRELHEEYLVSRQDLENIESRLRVSEAQLDLAKAQVRQAEATMSELRLQHGWTRIYSPLNGYVGERHLEPGALLNPSVPIVSVLNLNRVKTIVPISESDIKQIRTGLPAEIVVDAFPDLIYKGTITRISPYLNPETRSADVEIEIENRNHMLKPGMFVRSTIDARISETSLSIPRSALLTRGAMKGVYFPTQEDKRTTVFFQAIKIGRIDGAVVEVLDGLQEGMQVVSTGAQNLNEGDLIRVRAE